jgi:hypothetical protein
MQVPVSPSYHDVDQAAKFHSSIHSDASGKDTIHFIRDRISSIYMSICRRSDLLISGCSRIRDVHVRRWLANEIKPRNHQPYPSIQVLIARAACIRSSIVSHQRQSGQVHYKRYRFMFIEIVLSKYIDIRKLNHTYHAKNASRRKYYSHFNSCARDV